jgi:hypothetical protein
MVLYNPPSSCFRHAATGMREVVVNTILEAQERIGYYKYIYNIYRKVSMHFPMTSSSSSSSSLLLLTCTQPQSPSLRNRICRIRRRWCGERRTTNRWWNDCKGWLFLAVTIAIFRTTIAMPHLLITTTTTTTTITNTRMAFPSSTSNRIAGNDCKK